MLRRLIAIVRYLRTRRRETELDAELREHFERQTEENIRRGMEPAAARRAARITVGGMEQLKEECREARSGRMVEAFLQDIRYGLRLLAKNPGFSAMAILTLALGIGANTAIFSVVYGVLLRPLPYQNGSRIVVLHQDAPPAQQLNFPFSVKEIADYRERNHTLDAVVEYHSMVFLLLGNDTAERVQTGVVSANFFDVLGVQPLLGRTFVDADEKPNSNAVLVLSYKYWRSNQGGDPAIVGKIFQMNNRPHTVIGVLPPVPQYPAENDVYMPTSQCPFRSRPAFIANRRARMMTAFGRLRPGVTLETARTDLAGLAGQIAAEHPDVYPPAIGYSLHTEGLRDELTRRARLTFLILLGAAGLVLLIACANVGNLLLARALHRKREMAVRAALGASRARLIRQTLTESMVVSMAGGILGLALTPLTLQLLIRFAGNFTTRATEVRVDTPVLLFTLAVSLLTGLTFGLLPALSRREASARALSQGGTRTTAGRGHHLLRAALVVAQVAVSFMLLVGAGLMIRSFERIQQVDPGFKVDRLLRLRVSPAFNRYNTQQLTNQLWRDLARRVKSVAGVETAAVASNVPFSPDGIASGPQSANFEMEGKPLSLGQAAPAVSVVSVDSNYFDTIRQPIVKGRAFTERDDANAEPIAIVNQTMARHRWPGEDPVGRRITVDHGAHWIRIQGIAGDAKEFGLDQPTGDELYFPIAQGGAGGDLVVRTSQAAMSVAPEIRAAIHQLDSRLAIDRVETIEHMQYEAVASPRVTTILLGLFAVLAMLISACGIAAVMALSVSQRTHELGIRMALGAQRSRIIGSVVFEGFLLALTGAVIGSMGAIAAGRVISSLLYSTSPRDGFTYLAVSAVFLGVAAAASFLPARRVTAIDPLMALRQD